MVSNTVTAYVFTTVQVGEDDVVLDYRRTMLGVVPARRVCVRVPRTDIVDARVAASVHLDRLAVGVVAIAGAVMAGSPAVGVGLGVVGLMFVLISVVAVLRVTTRSRRYDAPICLREIATGRRLSALIGAGRGQAASAATGEGLLP